MTSQPTGDGPTLTPTDMRIVVGSDHYGLPLKNVLRDHLISLGYAVDDFGVNSADPVDYPDIGSEVALAVAAGKYDRAILVCGTGAGMVIVANKIPGVRAVSVQDPYTAERAVASNNAQIMTMGAQVTGPEDGQEATGYLAAGRIPGRAIHAQGRQDGSTRHQVPPPLARPDNGGR